MESGSLSNSQSRTNIDFSLDILGDTDERRLSYRQLSSVYRARARSAGSHTPLLCITSPAPYPTFLPQACTTPNTSSPQTSAASESSFTITTPHAPSPWRPTYLSASFRHMYASVATRRRTAYRLTSNWPIPQPHTISRDGQSSCPPQAALHSALCPQPKSHDQKPFGKNITTRRSTARTGHRMRNLPSKADGRGGTSWSSASSYCSIA
jgi:hypothetical protein